MPTLPKHDTHLVLVFTRLSIKSKKLTREDYENC